MKNQHVQLSVYHKYKKRYFPLIIWFSLVVCLRKSHNGFCGISDNVVTMVRRGATNPVLTSTSTCSQTCFFVSMVNFPIAVSRLRRRVLAQTFLTHAPCQPGSSSIYVPSKRSVFERKHIICLKTGLTSFI